MDSGVTLDPAAVLNRVGGDEKLLEELIALFLQEYPRLLAELWAAGDRGDCVALTRAAHTLKGQIAFFGAVSAYELVLRLEMMGREGKLEGYRDDCSSLETEMGLLRARIAELTGKPHHEDSGCR